MDNILRDVAMWENWIEAHVTQDSVYQVGIPSLDDDSASMGPYIEDMEILDD